jgi:hypothetical protein
MALEFFKSRWLIAGAVLIGIIVVLAAGWAGSTSAAGPLWRDVAARDLLAGADRLIVPTAYRTLALDVASLRTLLATAPLEGTPAARMAPARLELPTPDGGFMEFRFSESPVMEPALAAKFPEIKTYLGYAVADPTVSARFDLTPQGFHALILDGHGQIYIDPYARNDQRHYISYNARDFKPSADKLAARMAEGPVPAPTVAPRSTTPPEPSGDTLRTYRLAMGATAEYTAYHGGKPQAIAAIVTTVNRVDGVYEREVAVRLVLVANNDQLVFTDTNADGYTNDDPDALLDQNQAKLDSVIGSANYDVGHVFSTGGGGLAQLAVICEAGFKAQGETGSSQPVGDPFDIDYVAHELGHQFGGNHTFNGTADFCEGNREGPAAYEPGSGSTIMAYAGICGAEDLQPHSDDYFHTKSFEEITDHITDPDGGDRCGSKTSTGNTPPTVSAGVSHTIPRQTPFTLTGSASDVNGDSLTYDWEQYDLGAETNANSVPYTDLGDGPLFRSFSPSSSPARTFPRLASILSNSVSFGETLPNTSRTLNFRLTVRDNRAGGGGVNVAEVAIPVTASAGPFLVTAPNTAVSWSGLGSQTVTWNVAGTTAAPVNCASVDILLSTDGGQTFPTTLAAATANDGSAAITVPNISTTTARIKVACAGNIFFDIGNSNFTITPGSTEPPKLIYLPTLIK